MKMKKFILMLAFIFFGTVSCSMLAISKQTGDSVDFTFTGLLQAMTACSINNDRTIEIAFGNIGINKIESENYTRNIDYELDCGSVGGANTVLLTLKATPVPSDGSIIDSGRKGLWIQFYKDSVPLKLNEEFKVENVTAPPKLMVKLITDPAEDPEEGPFSCTATLIAEYI
ncbi:fimbrial protein [Citrobacter braakii]|nr:pilus assembly protein [Citrobacter sp. TSA-1]TCC76214.1 fimbrial protein [Citrobacter braakii]